MPGRRGSEGPRFEIRRGASFELMKEASREALRKLIPVGAGREGRRLPAPDPSESISKLPELQKDVQAVLFCEKVLLRREH